MASILVIDDNELVLNVMHEILKAEGYDVIGANNGTEALKLFRMNPTDIIITDMNLPQMDGINIINKILSINSDVKIIAVSGGGMKYGSTAYLTSAQLAGAHRGIMKPFRAKELLEAVRELL